MVNVKAQGNNSITSGEKYTRPLFHFNYFTKQQIEIKKRVEKYCSKMNQTVVISSSDDSFFS